jgi:prevent-host-death family protein
MDVAVSELRANLREWLARVREGHEVVVTERGIPVARLTAVDATAVLERLIEEGQIGRPQGAGRPVASGRPRPRPRRSLAEIVSEQRR